MALTKIYWDLICTRYIRMVFVNVILAQLAESGRYWQEFVWAKTFIDSAGELPRIFLAQEKLHFVLLAPRKNINKSLFTQSFLSMKFRTQCPNLCRADYALLAPERRLT